MFTKTKASLYFISMECCRCERQKELGCSICSAIRVHSAEFIELLKTVMPDWRHHKDILNSLPLAYDKWTY
jgi:hypothetical protein